MSIVEKLALLLSGLCLIWVQGMFVGTRLIGKWRDKQHYAPLWILICLPAHLCWVSVLLEVR